jgi:hypothetical protein
MADQFVLFTDQRAGEYPVPEGATSAACRSCGARIVWTRTAAGKPIPLSVATIQEHDGVRYALTHFADCPESREWRRR